MVDTSNRIDLELDVHLALQAQRDRGIGVVDVLHEVPSHAVITTGQAWDPDIAAHGLRPANHMGVVAA